MTRTAILALTLTVALTGCAAPALTTANYAYTAANTGTTLATSKGLQDHALSALVEGDCNWMNLFKGLYYCKLPTYNQSGL
jgi:hypothetical protein